MPSPVTALLWFAALCAGAALVFWPHWGVWSRIRRVRQASLRVQIEDALKHLYKLEYWGTPFTLDGLAGALEISRLEAGWLLKALQERGLVSGADGDTALSEEGRAYALRVIRTHRLWERFLADRTGVEPDAWHELAEEREHALSLDDVETLASRLGHPRYDPHGDPIPTSQGEMPPAEGRSLHRLSPGQEGMIVHLEDEPREIYEALLREGLSPGMPLRVEENDPLGDVALMADGRRISLPSPVARNVTVQLRPVARDDLQGASTLADLRPGEAARVLGLSPRCQGIQRRRLLDLGVVPGTEVTAELRSAGGDPVAYLVRGALIALRREQAAWVRVERDRTRKAS